MAIKDLIERPGEGEGAAPSSETLRFGAFELDARSLELRRSGRKLPLPPQPARVLALLAERAPELVTREELVAEVWGEGHFVDSEAGLNSAVKQIRQLLDDSPRAPRFVETLPRRGYRFVAPVERAGISSPARASAPRRRLPRWAWVGAAMLVSGVTALWLWFERPMTHGPAPVSSPPPPAIDAYFKGRFVLRQGGDDSGERAAALFDRALALDPDNVPALVGRSESAILAVQQGGVPVSEGLETARTSAGQALELDAGHGRAWAARARARWLADWDWQGAAADFERALALAPDDAALFQTHAFFLSALGDHERALSQIAEARRLDPLSPVVNLDGAWLFFHARRYEAAVAEGLRALELDPTFFPAHYCLSQAYAFLGHREEAARHLAAMLDRAGAEDAEVARVRALPPTELAEAASEWWLSPERRGRRALPLYEEALIHLSNGDRAEALRLFAESVGRREGQAVMLAVDPRLDGLREQAEFQELLTRIGRAPAPA